jgi:FkbM family methyltransferase
MIYPVAPTIFSEGLYQQDWYERDYFISKDGTGEFPDHHCKVTWVASLPFITSKRNAVDIGCRDGEYTRYLHNNFDHVFCFDYRSRKLFHKNVDLNRITHFKCGLADQHKKELVSGGGSMTTGKIPQEKYYEEQLYTLDEFKFENIDYIKIDVDGFELRVLQGCIETIKKYEPLLIIEQENDDRKAINYCSTLGYEIAAWDNDHRNVIMRKKI